MFNLKMFVGIGVLVGSASMAQGALYVVPNSQYLVRLFTLNGGPLTTRFNFSPTFDGITQNTALSSGAAATITESETDQLGKKSRIDIVIEAEGDIFPDDDASTGWGWQVDGIDLNGPTQLISARIRLFDETGTLLADSGIGSVQTNPWNGGAPGNGTITGFPQPEIQTADIRRVEFEFNIVPTPGAVSLMAIAGVCAQRRRRLI